MIAQRNQTVTQTASSCLRWLRTARSLVNFSWSLEQTTDISRYALGFLFRLSAHAHAPQVWSIEPPEPGDHLDGGFRRPVAQRGIESTNGWRDYPPSAILPNFFLDTMLYALSRFVSIPSVSNSPQHREDCRQGAIWLKKCLNQLGASQSTLVGSSRILDIKLLTFDLGIDRGNNQSPRVSDLSRSSS